MKRATTDQALIDAIARNVVALRKAAAMSQEDLADAAELDRTYISQVERKMRNLTVSVLARIARALNTTPDKLLISGTRAVRHSPRKKA
jgi:transcriptional regulator with XRE-family HTH domain